MDPDLAFQAELRDKWAYPVLAAVAVFVVAVVGIGLLPADGEGGQTGLVAATTTSPSASASTSPSRAATPTPVPEVMEVVLGGYSIQAPDVAPKPAIRIHLMVPAGWASAEGDTALHEIGISPIAVGLAIHAVSGVVTEVCSPVSRVRFKAVGPTVEDMTSALATIIGPDSPGPKDVVLGGYPATKFVLTDILDACEGGPEGRWLWEGASGTHFGLLKGATANVFVVDVDGDRLVITTHERGASAEDVAELNAMIASIYIEPSPHAP